MLRIERTQGTADVTANFARRPPAAKPVAGSSADDADAKAKPGSAALVPILPTRPRATSAGSQLSRPDSSFLAHLIATAEQVPQTRRLRRAEPQEALSAYAAQQPTPQAGRQTRHEI
jgi:hypothetical protein